MQLRSLLIQPRSVYRAYPSQFWILILGTFIDRIGGALVYPFFSLYVTRKFDVGMTDVGLVFGLFSISSVVGSTFGGGMTDRLGRKGMLIFGLVGSASATLLMGLADSLGVFLVSTLLVGLLAHSGGPAQQAMVADLLPPEKPAQGFGTLLSLNAAMVVLFQFPIARWISSYRPLRVIAGGMVLYALGFGAYGAVSSYALFLVAVATLTVGEMLTAPTSQSLVSQMAPERMRGRYTAAYGFSWVIPAAVGPTLAGLVMDYADPRWVWYGTATVGLVAAGMFLWLQRRTRRSFDVSPRAMGLDLSSQEEVSEPV